MKSEQLSTSFTYRQNFTNMIRATKGLILNSLRVYRIDNDTLGDEVPFSINCVPSGDIIITPIEM